MDVFDLRNRLVSDYRDYTRSFIKIGDCRIRQFVDSHLAGEGFWPQPLLQLNPTFKPGGTIDDLVAEGVLHEKCSRVFRIGKSDTDHRGKQLWVRLFFVGGPISLSGGGEAGGNWIRQGVVRSGGGSGGRRYFCRQRPMGDFRWSSRAS